MRILNPNLNLKLIGVLAIFASFTAIVASPLAEAVQPRDMSTTSYTRHIYIVYETGIVQRLVDTGIEAQGWVKSQPIPNGYSLHYEVGKYYLIPTSLYFRYPTQGITVR